MTNNVQKVSFGEAMLYSENVREEDNLAKGTKRLSPMCPLFGGHTVSPTTSFCSTEHHYISSEVNSLQGSDDAM